MSRTLFVAALVVVVTAVFTFALGPARETAASALHEAAVPSRGQPVAAPPIIEAKAGPVASSTRAPIERLSTDHDLFEAYRALRQSDAGGDLYVARAILVGCFNATRPDSFLRAIAAGRPMRTADTPPKPVQIDAALDLLARCRGFDGTTKLEVQQSLADTGARLGRADDAVGRSEALMRGQRRQSDDLLRSILASQDPVAIGEISSQLAYRWRQRTKQPTNGDEETRMALLAEQDVLTALVTCDLGSPCGSDTFVMKEYCAFNADRCGLDLRALILSARSPEDRLKIEDEVAMFVRAIRDNDFAFWGL